MEQEVQKKQINVKDVFLDSVKKKKAIIESDEEDTCGIPRIRDAKFIKNDEIANEVANEVINEVAEEQEVCKCVHDPISKNSTLKKASKRFLIHPEVQDFVCKECKKIFRYTKHGTVYTLVDSKKA